jgi:hypothetical protein
MSTIYTVCDDADGVTAATDVVQGTVAAEKPVYLHLLEIMQTTDLGDAAEEVIRIGVYRAVTAGSGGGTPAETGFISADDPAATASLLSWNTTASTGGTLLYIIGWNIRIPTPWVPVPELRPKVAADEDPYAFRLMGAPTDSLTTSVTHAWEEI